MRLFRVSVNVRWEGDPSGLLSTAPYSPLLDGPNSGFPDTQRWENGVILPARCQEEIFELKTLNKIQ